MNFLAHIYLSGNDDLVKFGNFIGDWVKGRQYEIYEERIQQGILLHRQIDSFTDAHPITREFNSFFRPAYGKFAGVVSDVVFDHFLSVNWTEYSDEELPGFVSRFHTVVKANINLLPAGARRFTDPFMHRKRLLCYGDFACLHDVLQKMSIYTSLPSEADRALQILEFNYKIMNERFNQFFIQVCREFL